MHTLIGLAILLCLMVAYTEATCRLSMSDPRPLEVKAFGSLYFLDGHSTTIEKQTDETVTFYCSKGFQINNRPFLSQTIVSLYCHPNGYFYTVEAVDLAENIFCADNQRYEMFESNTSLPTCEKYMTLVIGRDFSHYGSSKYLAICYDIDNLQLKFISYMAYPRKNEMIKKTQIGQLNSLGLDINITYADQLFKTFNPQSMVNFNSKYANIVPPDTFEYKSLIQDGSLTEMIQDYDNMMSIMWLRNLRTGNWRNWLNALHKANKIGHKFDVRVGISGITKLQSLLNPCKNDTLTLELDNDVMLAMPEFIWAYVSEIQASNLTTNELVIVGYNNPFIQIDETNQICNSMCNQVSWLNKSLFIKFQSIVAFGLVHCCRVKDVATKLDNFPLTSSDN